MTAVDGGLLLLLLLFGLRGFWRGFLREALGLAGVVLAGALVVGQSERIATVLTTQGGFTPLSARLVSAVGLALVVFIGVRLIGGLVARLTAALFLRPLDRIAGVGLGVAEGAALLGLALAAVLRMAPTSDISTRITASQVATPLLQVADQIIEKARPLAAATRGAI
jgi:membrane protein required for colicin V production